MAPDLNQRNQAIDLMRALCILYIVGFWHLLGYAHSITGYKNAITYRLTLVVLGLFILISGHLIGKAKIQSLSDIGSFYRRRLIRIYPPYGLALLLFASCGLIHHEQLLPSLLLVSSFSDDPPRTLWYIGMIMIFYLLAPFLMLLRQRLASWLGWEGMGAAWILTASLVGLNAQIGQHASHVDQRLFLYFPAFVMGLLLSSQLQLEQVSARSLRVMAILALTTLWWSFGINDQVIETSLKAFPLASFAPLALLMITSRWLNHRRFRIPPVLMMVSTASYFMYLLHRPIFYWISQPMASMIPNQGVPQVAYLLGVGLSLTVLVAWLGQRLYDRMLRAIAAPR